MLDYSEITDEPDLEFAGRLTADFGVAAIPPSVFYHHRKDYRSCVSVLPKKMIPCRKRQKSYARFRSRREPTDAKWYFK